MKEGMKRGERRKKDGGWRIYIYIYIYAEWGHAYRYIRWGLKFSLILLNIAYVFNTLIFYIQ